jgi:signal transduction histidine kinase
LRRIRVCSFRQVLFNLLSNACKFTPSGGTVRVSITSQPTGAIRVEVTDTGVGIAPPEQARLFQVSHALPLSLSPSLGLPRY